MIFMKRNQIDGDGQHKQNIDKNIILFLFFLGNPRLFSLLVRIYNRLVYQRNNIKTLRDNNNTKYLFVQQKGKQCNSIIADQNKKTKKVYWFLEREVYRVLQDLIERYCQMRYSLCFGAKRPLRITFQFILSSNYLFP